jgi:hypothetical protein
MKRKLRILLVAIMIVAAPLLSLAQSPPHPNGGSNPGPGNGPVGGGAPLGSGLAIMLAFAAVYGTQKLIILKKKTLVA